MGYKYKQRVKVGTDEHGQAVYRWAVGQTIDELHESIFSLKAHSERKEDQPAPISFGEYLQNWFSVYKRPKLKPKALSQYECKLKKHILPAFGQKPIAEITVLDIQTFLNERKDYSKSYMRDLMNILGQVFQAAFDDGLIAKNPMASRKICNPATRVEKRTALTDKEVADIIAHIPDLQNQNDRMFMACLMFTGMRPGEIYGLRWEDISPDEGIIHIRRAIAFCKNKAIIGDTKTKAGVRSIPLSPRLLKFLEPCGEEGFIINREGEPYTEQAHKRAWERIKRTIDVHGMTPYIGRHTYLTALNREGVDLKTIQAIAGHEDERMALRTYIHCDETLVNNAGKAMEARFERMTAM